MADKPELIVVSEADNLLFLRYSGLYPKEFYTDLEIFRKKAVFFDNVVIIFLTVGCSSFSRRALMTVYNQMLERANDENDTGVYDVIFLTDAPISGCKDYLVYTDHPFNVTRYTGKRATSKPDDLLNLIEYEESKKTTTYLRDADYGFNRQALDGVRIDRTDELELIRQIKRPDYI